MRKFVVIAIVVAVAGGAAAYFGVFSSDGDAAAGPRLAARGPGQGGRGGRGGQGGGGGLAVAADSADPAAAAAPRVPMTVNSARRSAATSPRT